MYGYHEVFNLSPAQVLQKVSEEQIFEFILKRKIVLNKREYISPFRPDSKPGCRIVPYKGKLWFEDYASGQTPRDCFNMVQDYYQVNLAKAIQIICEYFYLSSDLSEYSIVTDFTNIQKGPKTRAEIAYQARAWERRDKLYWSRFLVTVDELEQDKVLPLRGYSIFKNNLDKSGSEVINFSPYDVTYLYSFDPRYKLYRPLNRNTDYRFITNCDENDIGNLSRINIYGDNLTITKSYKDYRVLSTTLGTNNVLWLQNETVIPNEEILTDLTVRFNKIHILYDNDRQGEEGSEKLQNKILEVSPSHTINRVFLPKVKFNHKDPAEFISKEGRQDLSKVLKNLGLYGTGTREDSDDCPFLVA